MLDLLKGLLSPFQFSLFSYVLVILYFATGVMLVGFTANFRTKEQDKFRCDVSVNGYLTALCFEEYDRQYNSPLPLYGIVALNFATVCTICLIYSCCVHSRVRMFRFLPEAEHLNFWQPTGSRRVFRLYFLQLVTRLGLMTLFTVLQKSVFYPYEFPTEFSCVLSTAKPQNITNSTRTNTVFEGTSYASDCHSPFAREKTSLFRAIWAVNIVVILLLFGECIYLVWQALKSSDFSFDSQFVVRYLISQRETANCKSPLEFRKGLKRRILQETEKLDPLLISRCERVRLFDDMFVDPVIFTGIANGGYDEILTANHTKVLIVGHPGTGKSLLCKKLLRDWSKTNAFTTEHRFDFAFLFEFHWFNSPANETISLRKLIHRAAHSKGDVGNHVFRHLVDNPEKILLMFDGLDEFSDRKRFTENHEARYEDDFSMEMPFFALYLKLLQRRLLPGATVLTTCRASAVESLNDSWFNKTVELVGFTKEKVLQYVDNFCKQDEDSMVATRIKEHMTVYSPLLSLCRIPSICHIICYFLSDAIKEGSPESLTRITGVYEAFLKLFTLKHHPKYRNNPVRGTEHLSKSVKQGLAGLEALARKGIDESRAEFTSEDVVTGMMNYGLLNKLPDIKVTSVEWKEQFCFIDKTLQQFLAAKGIVKMDPGELAEFIDSNADDPKWHLVIQFVAGLLCGKQSEAVNSLVDHLLDSLLYPPTDGGKMALLILKCLYEYNDEATAKSAAFELQTKLQENDEYHTSFDLSNCGVTPGDCTAIVYFLKHVDSLNYSVSLDGNFVGQDGCKELSTLIEIGGPSGLFLANNKITDQDLESLVKASTREKSNLKEFYVGSNKSISPNALLHLCDALKIRNCKLTTLDLSDLQFSDAVLSKLCESLEHANCKLTDLMLGGSDITDGSMQRLCKSLKLDNCELTGLYISSGEITDEGLVYLCEALLQSSCKITTLKLSSNKISDVGMMYMCFTLRQENCNLTVLDLTSDQITDKAVHYLLRSSRHDNFKLEQFFLESSNITTANRTAIRKSLEDRGVTSVILG